MKVDLTDSASLPALELATDLVLELGHRGVQPTGGDDQRGLVGVQGNAGDELLVPGLMSATRVVPAAVVAHRQALAGFEAAQGLPGPQDRQGAFEPAQVEVVPLHGRSNGPHWSPTG